MGTILVKMADDGEVDVLGDFDIKIEVDNAIYDANELPSKSANLLPEFTDPPWLLEQGWPLDSCIDEKSKATIEKMLLEEQYYINGKTSRSKPKFLIEKRPQATSSSETMSSEDAKRTVWTAEEKDMFLKGMEIYGRSWTKIAELIPSRTNSQIKSYAHQYFRQMKNEDSPVLSEELKEEPPDITSDPLSVAIATVSTANPTILTRRMPILPKLGRIPQRDKDLMNKNKPPADNQTKKNVNKTKNRTTKHKGKRLMNSQNKGVVAKGRDKKHKSFDGINVTVPEPDLEQQVNNEIETSSLETKFTITPDLIENLDGFCAVADIVTVTTSNEAEEPEVVSDTDEDVDVDIEDDSETSFNPFFPERSVSPNSVYEKLLSDANIKIDKRDATSNSGFANISKPREIDGERIEEYTEDFIIKEEIDSSDTEVSADEINSNKNKDEDITVASVKVEETGEDNSPDKSNSNVREQSSDETILENPFLTVDGDILNFSVPLGEVKLEPDEITDEEREALKEFFDNRPSKTPERYLKIRNYIIEVWRRSKPNYVNKTSVRSGLKNCGDVNSIGRVHAYLECVGAINFGCDQVCYKNPRPLGVLLGKERNNKDSSVNTAKLEAMRPRKRKVKDEFGVWIDPNKLEGVTILPEGTTIEHVRKADSSQKESKPKQAKQHLYDPFKLIPCLPFTDENPAPFTVEIHGSALAVTDIHSHICKTEVIGMLGGQYLVEQGKLVISMATPCNSISTGMQCEMDPVSQTQASEEISCAGLDVVGWYHSHPSFAPNPSVRDIETQLKFQDWFSKGGSQFVSVIVSPYNQRNPGLCSEVNCLTVSDEFQMELKCNIPYKFSYMTRLCDRTEVANIVMCAQDLATSYSNYPNKIDLTSSFISGITCLEKMLESLKSYGCDIEDCLEKIRDVFSSPVRLFTDCTATFQPTMFNSEQFTITSDVLLGGQPSTSFS